MDTDNAMVERGRVLEKLILFSMKGFIRSRDGGLHLSDNVGIWERGSNRTGCEMFEWLDLAELL